MHICGTRGRWVNTLRPRQNGRHFADVIFKCNFLDEDIWTLINLSLKFVPKGQINNIPALVQIMAWHQPGDKPLSEPMMVSLLMHICVTQPQWVKLTFILVYHVSCVFPCMQVIGRKIVMYPMGNAMKIHGHPKDILAIHYQYWSVAWI